MTYCVRRLVTHYGMCSVDALTHVERRYGRRAWIPNLEREQKRYDDLLKRIRAHGWRVPVELDVPRGTRSKLDVEQKLLAHLAALRVEVERPSASGTSNEGSRPRSRPSEVAKELARLQAPPTRGSAPSPAPDDAGRRFLDSLGIPTTDLTHEMGDPTAQAEAKRRAARADAQQKTLEHLPRLRERLIKHPLEDGQLADDELPV